MHLASRDTSNTRAKVHVIQQPARKKKSSKNVNRKAEYYTLNKIIIWKQRLLVRLTFSTLLNLTNNTSHITKHKLHHEYHFCLLLPDKFKLRSSKATLCDQYCLLFCDGSFILQTTAAECLARMHTGLPAGCDI